jgi:hypothetical protein
MGIALVVYLLINVFLVSHCLRTGRSYLWILSFFLFAPLSWLTYILLAVLPDILGGPDARAAWGGMQRALNPGANLRRYEAEMQRSGDVASRQHYADALIVHGRATEAVDVYRQALTGLYATDPTLLFGLARAQFAAGQFAEARASLEDLRSHNRQFPSPDAHLLYARALEAEGNAPRALEEYAAVLGYFAGAEAPVRYAQLLRATGHKDEAQRILKDLLDNARIAPRYYRRMQRQWLVTAEHELSTLR